MHHDTHTPATMLVADIGGTHSRFALFEALPGPGSSRLLRHIRQIVFRTAEHNSATELFSRLFSEESGLFGKNAPSPDVAVLAIPGATRGKDPFVPPFRENCYCANISWPISWEEGHAVLGTEKIYLVNDFTAQAFACAALQDALDAVRVLPGTAVSGEPMALVGAGTGYGQAFILPGSGAGSGPSVLPSEGGHTLFPFTGKEEFRFSRFLDERFPARPVIKDLVLSGTGLAALYAFHTGDELPVEQVTDALDAKNPRHDPVFSWYARFYARACRESVLNSLPRGGVFISGGMARRVSPLFGHPAFREELFDSPIIRESLPDIPYSHVRNPSAGLWGAAAFGAFCLFGPVSLAVAQE